MINYVASLDAVSGSYVVLEISNGPAYTVVAICDSEARAIQVAELLTEAAA